MKRPWFLVLLFTAVVFICFLVFFPTDKKRIWKVIAASEKAVINEDLDGLMKNISYNYSDEYGGSYLLIKKRMQSEFKRLNNIDIEDQLVNISVSEEQAEAEMNVKVSVSQGEDRAYIVGDAVNWQKMKIYLEKSPYMWRVIKVNGLVGNDF